MREDGKYATIRANGYPSEYDLPLPPLWRGMDATNGGPAETLRRLQNALLEHSAREAADGAPEEESDGEEMSESEAFEAQGRAHAALKEAKSRAATIRSVMLDSARNLTEAAGLVSQFLGNPLARSSTGVPLAAHLKNELEAASSHAARAARLVDELVEQTQRIQELEGEIAQF